VIALAGDDAPNVPAGVMVGFDAPALNDNDELAFVATVRRSRDLRLVVRPGDSVPGGGMILRFSERVAIDESGGLAFGAYVGNSGNAREAVLHSDTDGLCEIALEGEPAPGGGRYAGFGPWPMASPDGATAFIAGLDGGAGPLAAFIGTAGPVRPVAVMGQALPAGGRIGCFALNSVAVAGPGQTLTFSTEAEQPGQRSAIYCHWPQR
jgi:hypothetical protein